MHYFLSLFEQKKYLLSSYPMRTASICRLLRKSSSRVSIEVPQNLEFAISVVFPVDAADGGSSSTRGGGREEEEALRPAGRYFPVSTLLQLICTDRLEEAQQCMRHNKIGQLQQLSGKQQVNKARHTGNDGGNVGRQEGGGGAPSWGVRHDEELLHRVIEHDVGQAKSRTFSAMRVFNVWNDLVRLPVELQPETVPDTGSAAEMASAASSPKSRTSHKSECSWSMIKCLLTALRLEICSHDGSYVVEDTVDTAMDLLSDTFMQTASVPALTPSQRAEHRQLMLYFLILKNDPVALARTVIDMDVKIIQNSPAAPASDGCNGSAEECAPLTTGASDDEQIASDIFLALWVFFNKWGRSEIVAKEINAACRRGDDSVVRVAVAAAVALHESVEECNRDAWVAACTRSVPRLRIFRRMMADFDTLLASLLDDATTIPRGSLFDPSSPPHGIAAYLEEPYPLMGLRLLGNGVHRAATEACTLAQRHVLGTYMFAVPSEFCGDFYGE